MRTVPFRQILGSLIYLSIRTRSDLCTAVSMLGKLQDDPSWVDWIVLKHVMWYLHGSVDLGILVNKQTKVKSLISYSDANHGRNEDSRRFSSGMLLLYSEPPIVWSSEMQEAATLSTTEVEFHALAACVKEDAWICKNLRELRCNSVKQATLNYQDNLGAICWTRYVQVCAVSNTSACTTDTCAVKLIKGQPSSNMFNLRAIWLTHSPRV